MMKKNLLSRFAIAFIIMPALLNSHPSIAGNAHQSSNVTITLFPVHINSVSAIRNRDNSVSVNWVVDKEIGTRQYELERSINGSSFSTVEIITTTTNDGGRNVYDMVDWNAVYGEAYYRVKAIGLTGKVYYSAIVKVGLLKIPAPIQVFPNPVQNKNLHVHFISQPEGNYRLTLFDKLGQSVFMATVQVDNSNDVRTLQLPGSITTGTYLLRIVSPAKEKTVQQVIVN